MLDADESEERDEAAPPVAEVVVEEEEALGVDGPVYLLLTSGSRLEIDVKGRVPATAPTERFAASDADGVAKVEPLVYPSLDAAADDERVLRNDATTAEGGL